MSNKKRTTAGGRPSKFPPEFRRDAVGMVLDDDRPIAEVGRAIGVNRAPWVTGSASSASSGATARD
jgi:transposase-like protein